MSFQSTSLLKSLPESLSVHCVRSGTSKPFNQIVSSAEAKANTIGRAAPKSAERVIVAIKDPIACLEYLFAVWVAGHCAVLVNPKITPNERERVVAKTAASLWIDDDGITKCPHNTLDHQLLEDAALILMTSGTTGDPKGVTHSLATLEERLQANIAAIGPDALERTLCTLPLFFGHGLIGNCLTALYAGKSVHLWQDIQLPELPTFGSVLDERQITFFSSVPSFWRMILPMSGKPQHSPHRVHIGSAPLSQKVWCDIADWCGTENVFNTYGMTETANWISGGILRDSAKQDGFVGEPWGGSFKVMRDGELFDHGEGEVAVKSPGQMLGFWDDPDRTNDVMIADYMLTGDIGVLAQDQSLRLIGRSKHEINVGGIKVLAEEVDILLEQHPDVTEACGFGIPDEIAGERVAAIVRTKSTKLTIQELIAWCRKNARPDAIPSKLEIVQDIPKNDRGKIARHEVRQRMLSEWF